MRKTHLLLIINHQGSEQRWLIFNFFSEFEANICLVWQAWVNWHRTNVWHIYTHNQFVMVSCSEMFYKWFNESKTVMPQNIQFSPLCLHLMPKLWEKLIASKIQKIQISRNMLHIFLSLFLSLKIVQFYHHWIYIYCLAKKKKLISPNNT